MRLAQSETYYPRFQEPNDGVTAVEFGVCRLSDGLWWDFNDSTWQAVPVTRYSALTEDDSGLWINTTGWAIPDAVATYAVQFYVVDASGDFYESGPDIIVDASFSGLLASAGTIVIGTVSWDNTNATTTIFFSDDITEATADHFNGRIAIFTSGDLRYQATAIEDYELSAGEGKFTVTALTEPPADNVKFVIV